ncbi:MAG: hypothetical protein MUE73_12985 [Planctomycetes bacterium]|jgi:hypothetical protein|nr:hypothetical protein [Planctomycetota bacterium]
MAAEKAAGRRQKDVKSPAAAPRTAAEKAAARVRLVWVVCDNAGEAVKTFAFNEYEPAKEEAARLTEKKGKQHFVKKDKAPL